MSSETQEVRRGRPSHDLVCKECGKQFQVYNSYYSHMTYRHRPPSVGCNHCSEKFRSVPERNQHFYRAYFEAVK